MKVIIIGGGVSGLTSAIYLARANIQVIVFNKGYYGSLSDSDIVQNFPGFPEGISGYELLDNMNEQAIRFGVNIIEEQIVRVHPNKNLVFSDSGQTYQYDQLIISTGCKPRKINAKNAIKYEHKGIHYCATCDGSFYKDKEVIVVGGGNTAITESLYLSNIAKKVYVFLRRDVFRAQECLVEKLKACDNIYVLSNVQILQCFGQKNLESISFIDKTNNNIYVKDIDGIFVCIGSDKNLQLLKEIDINEYDNIYLNGDLTNKYRQAVIASGKGAQIALEIIQKNIK